MDRIIVDESFTRQMTDALATCLVFDSAGKRLGCFAPEVDAGLYQGVGPSVSNEELDRREHAGGGLALVDILSALQQRP